MLLDRKPRATSDGRKNPGNSVLSAHTPLASTPHPQAPRQLCSPVDSSPILFHRGSGNAYSLGPDQKTQDYCSHSCASVLPLDAWPVLLSSDLQTFLVWQSFTVSPLFIFCSLIKALFTFPFNVKGPVPCASSMSREDHGRYVGEIWENSHSAPVALILPSRLCVSVM